MFADVFEGAIAAIAIEDASGGGESAWRAVGLPFVAADFAVLRVPEHVTRDEKIEMAVVIVIEEAGRAAPASGRHAGLDGYIGESPIAIIVVERIFPVVGDVEVGIAVIVVIADGHAHAVVAVPCVRQAGFFRYIGEAAIRILAIEAIPVLGI